MMAKRVSTILPDMSFKEALEVTKIYSIWGNFTINGLIKNRPFRSPHHSITKVGLIGGGKIPKPGEISLAHNGVLYLDELPECNKNILEILRGPLEEKIIDITRIYGTYRFPCNFMLIASMNPCPCGFYGSKEKKCTCSESQIKKYRAKISGPLLDRIDIKVNVPNVNYEDFKDTKCRSSKEIKENVNRARKIQIKRYEGYEIFSNSQLDLNLIDKFCVLDDESKEIFKMYFEKLKLSARAYTRILKVARTIADLDEEEFIKSKHLIEAIQLSRFSND